MTEKVTQIEIKGSSGAYLFPMKAWRWDIVVDRNPKIDPLKSFPGADSVNETLAVDFGKHTRHVALMGRVRTNRQMNTLRDYVKNKWFSDQPLTLTIGTGGDKIQFTGATNGGLVQHVHGTWSAETMEWTLLIDFWNVVVFKI